MNTKQIGRLAQVRQLIATGEARSRRVNAHLSLGEVAGPCDVDASTVWRWETGKRVPRGEAALKYAGVLEMLASRESA